MAPKKSKNAATGKGKNISEAKSGASMSKQKEGHIGPEKQEKQEKKSTMETTSPKSDTSKEVETNDAMTNSVDSPAQAMDSDRRTDVKAQRNRRKKENQKRREEEAKKNETEEAEYLELLALMNTAALKEERFVSSRPSALPRKTGEKAAPSNKGKVFSDVTEKETSNEDQTDSLSAPKKARLFEIKQSPGKGLGVFASEFIEKER